MTEAIDATVMRAQLRVGTVLRGKWQLDRLLGVGGMAAVYAATHRNGTRAAIKMLHPELSTHGHVRSRFMKEGYAANRVEHTGVVRVLDDDTAEDGSLYLVMELLDGESLEERRERSGGRLEVDEVLAAADQILDVLSAAHARGIVHRDIKPENVFLTRDGVIKVLDFGIARLRELSTASGATKTGTTMGTPAFMAPEHARGLWDEVDTRSDLWSMGATMFALLTGRLVHEGRTANEILLGAMSKPAPPLASVEPKVPPHVAAVVDRALAYEKVERWPDAVHMQDAVRRAFHGLHGAPISTHPKLTVPPSVANRTLPSADAQIPLPGSVGTGPAVASGKTGVPLRSRSSSSTAVPKSVLVAIGVAGGAVVFVLAIVVIGLSIVRARVSDPRTMGTTPPTKSVADSTTPDAGTAPLPTFPTLPGEAPASSTPVVELEDLPTASPKRLPVTEMKSDAGKRVQPPTADWKEKRE